MEPSWQKWWAMALDSLEAARTLQNHGHARSSASRFYYAAYQAATAVLIYQGLHPPGDPEEREAWSHVQTPELLRKTVFPFWTQGERHKLAAGLFSLYKLRIIADYKSRTEIEPPALLRALKEVLYFVSRVKAALPPGE